MFVDEERGECPIKDVIMFIDGGRGEKSLYILLSDIWICFCQIRNNFWKY